MPWVCGNGCSCVSFFAPPCCTGGEISYQVDETVRTAPITDKSAPKSCIEEWDSHDCSPYCDQCGDDAEFRDD